MFTFLFFRFCDGLDFAIVNRELNNPHRLIVSCLGGLNAILSTITHFQIRAHYPDFLRIVYFILFLIVIMIGYIQLGYLGYAIVRGLILGP